MIIEDQLIPVGKVVKPHGYKGVLNVDITFDKSIFSEPKTPFFIKIDNILVPFFVESIGGGTDKMSFLKLKGINSDAEASMLIGKEIFAEKAYLADKVDLNAEEDVLRADDFIGYSVRLADSDEDLGEVEETEEGIEYDYITVRNASDGKMISIPFIDEFIESISDSEQDEKGTIFVNLPEGFLDI